jgi:hypothetical protein
LVYLRLFLGRLVFKLLSAALLVGILPLQVGEALLADGDAIVRHALRPSEETALIGVSGLGTGGKGGSGKEKEKMLHGGSGTDFQSGCAW